MTKIKLESKPALLVIDMQNGFVKSDGTFGKLGMDLSNHLKIIPTIKKLIQAFEERNLPIIFTKMAWSEDYSDAGILLDKDPGPQIKSMKGLTRDSWDADVIDELKYSKNMIALNKTRNTAFFKTGFDEILATLGVNQVIATGVGTNVCVESTVRDAFTYGFPCVTVCDATATLTKKAHDASIEVLGQWFGEAATADEIIAALQDQ